MMDVHRVVVTLAVLPCCAALQSCNQPTGLPSGSYEVDTVRFVPSSPKPSTTGPAPGVWIDTNTELSSLSGGTLSSSLPYGVAIDYTDNGLGFKHAEITSIAITYDDGSVDAAIDAVKLPLRITAREYELVNSVAGGGIEKSKASIISAKIPDVITRAEPLTLRMEGRFVKDDESSVSFTIDEHFTVEKETATKSAEEVLVDR